MKKNTESRLSRWSQMKIKSEDASRKKTMAAPAIEVSTLEQNDAPIDMSLIDDAQAAKVEGNSLSDIQENEVEELSELDLDTLSNMHDLPKIDDLNKDSDFTKFLTNGVPEILKRAAMRKLWLSDPVLANIDGLNDYDDDYTIVKNIVGGITTNYQVGKGMVDPNEVEDTEEPDKPAEMRDNVVADKEKPEDADAEIDRDQTSDSQDDDIVQGDDIEDLDETVDVGTDVSSI